MRVNKMQMQDNKKIARVYLTDYEGHMRDMLEELDAYLVERDEIISTIYDKKRKFLLSKKEFMKKFLEDRGYMSSKSYDPDSMNETFYCEANAHLLTLFAFDFLLIVVSSGSYVKHYKIELFLEEEKPDFRNTVLVEGIDRTIGFYGKTMDEITEEFVEEQLEKARHNIEIFRKRLENFDEDKLIYSYNDIERIDFEETLSIILNETRI